MLLESFRTLFISHKRKHELDTVHSISTVPRSFSTELGLQPCTPSHFTEWHSSSQGSRISPLCTWNPLKSSFLFPFSNVAWLMEVWVTTFCCVMFATLDVEAKNACLVEALSSRSTGVHTFRPEKYTASPGITEESWKRGSLTTWRCLYSET